MLSDTDSAGNTGRVQYDRGAGALVSTMLPPVPNGDETVVKAIKKL
jgi:hypothetical protein